ncbi:MAG: hydroxyacid dehydrogenase [Candidatus Humimicrobiaceae bacterium]
MAKVLLGQKIHKDAMNFLKNKGFEIIVSSSPEDEVVRKQIKDIDGLVVRTATKLSRETILAAKRLKVIGRTGKGVDNVDVKAASEKNIPVCNAPEANIMTVAEHAIAFMLALAKNLKAMDNAVRDLNWEIRNNYVPVDISGKTLGLVGFGNIGRAMARKCYNAFNMDIIAYDPFLPEGLEVNFPFKLKGSLDEVFTEADFVSLHIPYTKQNHHLVGKNLLGKMKKGSFLINTSRGGIVEEEALASILKDGGIAGAALDVFENEPPQKDNPLLGIERVILTPHSAALTSESSRRMAMHAVEGVADVLEGRKPRWVFNRNSIKAGK